MTQGLKAAPHAKKVELTFTPEKPYDWILSSKTSYDTLKVASTPPLPKKDVKQEWNTNTLNASKKMKRKKSSKATGELWAVFSTPQKSKPKPVFSDVLMSQKRKSTGSSSAFLDKEKDFSNPTAHSRSRSLTNLVKKGTPDTVLSYRTRNQ